MAAAGDAGDLRDPVGAGVDAGIHLDGGPVADRSCSFDGRVAAVAAEMTAARQAMLRHTGLVVTPTMLARWAEMLG